LSGTDNAISILNGFMPIMSKYMNVEVKDVKIFVEKYDDGTTLKIISDNTAVGDMLSDMMIVIAKMAKNTEGKITVEVDDKRE
jgi:septum formation topological specificity factor MinE